MSIVRNLPPFQSELVCVKCGSRDIGRTYHSKDECDYGCGSSSGPWIEQEHHRLTCRICGYDWRTQALKP